MEKTLLYRLFGIGKIPTKAMEKLKSERIFIYDEGIKVNIVYRKYKAPGKRFNYKSSGYIGSIILTEKCLHVYGCIGSFMRLEWDDPRLHQIKYELPEENIISIAFDPSIFRSNTSGNIEYRVRTEFAASIYEKIKEKLSR